MLLNLCLRGLLSIGLFFSLCMAHNIQLGAHSRECFHETLRRDDKMTVTFQVGDREFGGSGNIEIDFWVCACIFMRLRCCASAVATIQSGPSLSRRSPSADHPPQIQDPSGHQQVHTRGVSTGDHSFEAHLDGKFVYCFSNEHWSSNSKEVSFNVHGIVYVPESEIPSDPLEQEGTCRYIVHHMEEVRRWWFIRGGLEGSGRWRGVRPLDLLVLHSSHRLVPIRLSF